MERPIWDRIQEIYYSTLTMPKSERSAFIASACDHDPFMVREVTSLLKADDLAASFLESSVFELGLKIISSDGLKKPASTTDVPRHLARELTDYPLQLDDAIQLSSSDRQFRFGKLQLAVMVVFLIVLIVALVVLWIKSL